MGKLRITRDASGRVRVGKRPTKPVSVSKALGRKAKAERWAKAWRSLSRGGGEA